MFDIDFKLTLLQLLVLSVQCNLIMKFVHCWICLVLILIIVF